MATLRELAIRVTADSSSYQREMNRASRIGSDFYRTIEERSRRFDAHVRGNRQSIESLTYQLTKLKSSAAGVMATLGGGFVLAGAINTADDWVQMAVRVKNAVESVGGSVAEFEQVQNRLLEISNRNGKSIEDSQELYITTASSMNQLNYTTSQTVDLIEAMSNSYTINAASAEQVTASINALNKSFITGRIESRQWVQLMSSTPNIVSALSRSMKIAEQDVSKLGLAGKISTKSFVDAMISVRNETTATADAMGFTAREGMVVISNNFKTMLGEFNKTYGVTKKLADGLIFVANNVELIGGAVTAVVAIGISRRLGGVFNSLKSVTSEVARNTAQTRGNALAQKRLAEVELQKIEKQRQSIAVTQRALAARAQNIRSIQAGMAIRQASLRLDAQDLALTERQVQAKNRLAAANRQASLSGTALGALTRAGGGLLGMMGGVGGLVATVISLGAGFLALSDSADKAKKPMVELQLPVDQLIEKYKELDKARQDALRSDLKSEIKLSADNVGVDISEIEKKLNFALSEIKINSSGTYPIATRILHQSEKNAIREFIDELTQLKAKLNENAITSHEFGNKLHEAEQKLISATGRGESFRNTLTSLTSSILDNTGKLGENVGKLAAISAVATGAQTAIKTLNESAFPNLNNQLGVLNQQLEINKLKSTAGGEAAYILAGLQRAAGEAALEHSADLVALATNQKTSIELSEELAEKLSDLKNKLRDNYRAQEGLKTLPKTDKYRSQLNDLTKQINLQRDVNELEKLNSKIKSGDLGKLSETQKETLRLKAIELDRLNAQREYKNILESLRTPAEQQLDTYKKQLEIIEKANVSLNQRQELLSKTIQRSMESAPSGDHLNSFNGLGGEILDIAQNEKKLNDWRDQQVQLYTDLLNEKKLSHEEYADAVVSIEEEMQKRQQNIQNAYVSASLSTFSTLTSSVAEMFRETAGESSAAYKIMFLASKAASIAQAVVNTEVAATKSLEFDSTGTMANVVRGLGYASVGLIAAQTIQGVAHSGLDNIPREGTWLLDRGERVVDSRTNSDLKTFLRTANGTAGGGITVNTPIHINGGDMSIEDAEVMADKIKISVLAIVDNEMRQGGRYNNRS